MSRGASSEGAATESTTALFARRARLLQRTVEYELRKALAFRAGFVVRELLNGVARPLVMTFVYAAIFASGDIEQLRGWSFEELVRYMILVATLDKLVFHDRILDVSEQIFEGRITKYMVMPVDFFLLSIGRWLQFTAVQVLFASAFWLVGWLAFPSIWPVPVSGWALLQAVVLVFLGSYCCFLLYFIIHTLAFWLSVVWSLLVMVRFVLAFASGVLIPVSIMPAGFQDWLSWSFPYWMLSAPIELLLGRLETRDFYFGVAVLAVSVVVLDRVRASLWRRGIAGYTGSGM